MHARSFNHKVYERVRKYTVGDLVLRRLRERGGHITAATMKRSWVKEAEPQVNIGKTVYRIVRVDDTFPLPSYVLSKADDSAETVPGRFTATELVPAPTAVTVL